MPSRTLFLLAAASFLLPAADLTLAARDTVSGFEMNRGDTVRFRLRNGQVRTLVLEETSARVLLTNLRQLRAKQRDGGTLYEMRARVRVDGHPLDLVRYVGSQETLAVPYVINGMRLWLDAVRDALSLMSDDHGGVAGCAMSNQARFAANDLLDAVTPRPLHPWYPMKQPFLDIASCYNGDDPYFGAFEGAECHAGLDLNMPMGSPLWAPVDIEDHYLFNSLAAGDNNNRWRGFHTWPDGGQWTLQVHHIASLLVPEHRPIPAGAHYAAAAGVWVGSHEHSHFVFKVRAPGASNAMLLDPWILFWQLCEQERATAGEIRAAMAPVSPARTGDTVHFSSDGSRQGRWGVRLVTSWTFGDGGFSLEPNPAHTFARPGIYPVTLTISDGVDRTASTQLITIDGAPLTRPSLALQAREEPGFVERTVEARDSYGIPPSLDPHTIRIVARLGEDVARIREILAVNAGGGALATLDAPRIRYEGGSGWLDAALEEKAPRQRIAIRANPKRLTPGYYPATVTVGCAGCLNSPQQFRVVLEVKQSRPPADITVDDGGSQFYATPGFWLTPRFYRWTQKGFGGGYRTNGGRAESGQFARFTPDLRAGTYEVSLAAETPFQPGAAFLVKVRSRAGLQTIRMNPDRSRVLGTFSFSEGGDGYVEILADGSKGQVFADAVHFHRVSD